MYIIIYIIYPCCSLFSEVLKVKLTANHLWFTQTAVRIGTERMGKIGTERMDYCSPVPRLLPTFQCCMRKMREPGKTYHVSDVGRSLGTRLRLLLMLKFLLSYSIYIYYNSNVNFVFSWFGEGGMEGFLVAVPKWVELGARIIGGCCRVGPQDIKLIRQCVDSLQTT